ncbi:MAG TPA: Smr/MutS family protein [Gammaproteobacteria bacterium]
MNDKDRDAFAKAMQGVKPLRRDERATPSRKPRTKTVDPRRTRAGFTMESIVASSNVNPDEIEQIGEETAFRRAGVAENRFRQLRRGRFSIEAEADLHGLTVSEAKLLLREFICESALDGLGCVRVIHGKGLRSGPGGPVLKSNVHRWLSQWDEVLAYVTARARDGGSGALYVLLRRR